MTADPSSFAATLLRRLGAGDDALTLPVRAHSTISPERTRADGPGREAVAMLRRSNDGGATEGLEMLTTIGEGGMGVVRAARQRRLGREVAVKSLRDGLADEASVLALLREAWITGTLEHPNVVPVHDVTLDASGSPHIVLKRIAGSPWSELLGQDAEVRRRFGASDPFEWHVRVLLQVANAVEFAHSRGILHRDIKPENVMIGAFGEVYLLDWGIAVSLVDDGSGRLPLARDAVELAGTPVYMAPEMVCGEPERLSARTDVYLLGAVLFEIVTGSPPHDGANLREIITKVVASPPELPRSCPEELTRILRTAMALEPADRFADVEALRSALIAYLEHRGSLALARDATARAADLERVLAASDERPTEERRVAAYRTFAEARFGFLEALRAWPENEAARRGLREAVEEMVTFELVSGNPRSAGVLLSELDGADPTLVARVDAARAAQVGTDSRRRLLEANLDPSTGRRTRLALGCLLGVVWSSVPLVQGWLELHGFVRWTLTHGLIGAIAMAAIGGGLAWWVRDVLSETAVNRRQRNSMGVVLVGQIAVYAGGLALGADMHVVSTMKVLLYAIIAAQVTVAVDRSLWVVALSYGAAFAIASARPDLVFLAEAGASLTLTVTALVVWGLAAGPTRTPGAEARRPPSPP